jgi:hypothetical protein
MTDVEKCKTTIAELECKRAACVKRGTELADEQANVALGAHTGDKAARRRLDEINAALALHGSELASLDAALKAAEHLAAAERAVATAADRQRAAEMRKIVDEMAEVPAFIDKHLALALRGLFAIERGIAELHRLGVAFPSDTQLRLGVVAALGTWMQQLPRTWYDDLRDGRYLAPHEKKTFDSYWKALLPSLQSAIKQRVGEAERTNTEAA